MRDYSTIYLGGIAYFRVFGRHFAIINDPEIVTELFDKRSAIYSTRPVLVSTNMTCLPILTIVTFFPFSLKTMAGKLVGREKSALFLPYGQRSRITRKMIINFLSTRSLENLVPDVETETYKYISKLYYTPNKFFDHIIRSLTNYFFLPCDTDNISLLL